MSTSDSLRKELREKGILFKITKNRITKIAIKETPKKDLENILLANGSGYLIRSISTAKSYEIFKKLTKTKIIAGFMDGKVLDEKGVYYSHTIFRWRGAKIVGI